MCSDDESSFEMQSDDEYGQDEVDDYLNTSVNECEMEVNAKKKVVDFEHFNFECLSTDKVEKLLNESAEAFANKIHVAPPIAKILLRTLKWTVGDVVQDINALLIDARIKPLPTKPNSHVSTPDECPVCFEPFAAPEFRRLQCGHSFCISCWLAHFELEVGQGVSTEIECMETDCKILVPEDFALDILHKSDLRKKYNEFALRECVSSHPELRFCTGPNCRVVIRAEQPKSKRVTCNECDSSFCFNCGLNYHAPTDCATMKKWLAKCDADSGNATYLRKHTKDCPKCNFVIEKNGGCNIMTCTRCKFKFCWMCLGDLKEHTGSYRCSMYATPAKTVESEHEARVVMAKYLFYFDRWSNHAESLRLEHEALEKMRKRIEEKVMKNEGTWIDWQYLFDAAAALAKCRYTMQYTYSLAYFMEDGKKKELFEYQQAQFESAIEKLSWEIEHVESTGRGGVVSLMAACERSRATLLEEFGNYETGSKNL